VSTIQLHAHLKPALRAARWKVLLAFAIIYFVWGSTYLCIRIGVEEMPPFLMAALRFTIAGLVLFVWMMLKDKTWPTRREWLGATILGALMFLMDYSILFWAETHVPSGIAAVVLATIPMFIALLEIIFLRTLRLTLSLGLGLLAGILGVVALTNSSSSLSSGGATLYLAGVFALLAAALSWAIGTILTKKLTLPTSKAMSSALQMLTGGIQLFGLTLVSGEFAYFHPAQISLRAWLSLAYLIVAGSLIAFTAYVWLLDHEAPTKVGTYAYVNPVVAVIFGYFFAGESLGSRTILGTTFVLISVVTITLMSGKARRPKFS
jgi:drug/metabolite transporter (DMT)-like permease